MLRTRISIIGLAAGLLTVTTAATAAVVALPTLPIDSSKTTVSGLSSGGYMAVQMHVAYSATFRTGAGVVAGGPFYCAQNSIVNATGRCMASPAGIPTSLLVSTTNSWAAQGWIDPVANLEGSRLFLFSGSIDSTVKPGVMDALRTYYGNFIPNANIVYKKDLAAEHAMITDDYGSTCSVKASPYINNCNFDLAGAILQQLYGPLNPRNPNPLPEGNFIEFNQGQFITNHGMAASGWAYVPASCQPGAVAPCRLHVVFHGCQQNTSQVGQQFVRQTGYNRWADTNNIVVLYPQTSTAAVNSCWDWWGYDSADYAKKSGPQMAAVKAMVDHLASGATGGGGDGPLPAPTGLTAGEATSSSMQISWSAVTGAAGYNVYRNGSLVNASPVAGTSHTDSGLTAATTYSWSLRALDDNGAEGAASTPVTGTTLGEQSSTCHTASNYAHTTAGRAYQSFGYAYARGSNQRMGLWNVFSMSTLKQIASDHYVVGTCQ